MSGRYQITTATHFPTPPSACSRLAAHPLNRLYSHPKKGFLVSGCVFPFPLTL